MKSEWRVASNHVCGEIIYQVYRLLDIHAVDHSGNRQYVEGLFSTEKTAQLLADGLNAKEKA